MIHAMDMGQGFDAAGFIATNRLSMSAMCEDILERHRASIRIKRPAVAVANLERIIGATLTISNRKGFGAMSLRDLAEETGLSMGGLYAYFESKEVLLMMIIRQVHAATERVFAVPAGLKTLPAERLRWLIETHVRFTEVLRPWCFFSYMEARDFHEEALAYALANERRTEKLFADTLRDGKRAGRFAVADVDLTAALMKAMLQDWYVKGWKYRQRTVSVAEFAEGVVGFAEGALRPGPAAAAALPEPGLPVVAAATKRARSTRARSAART